MNPHLVKKEQVVPFLKENFVSVIPLIVNMKNAVLLKVHGIDLGFYFRGKIVQRLKIKLRTPGSFHTWHSIYSQALSRTKNPVTMFG